MAHHALAMTHAWPPFHQPHTTQRQRSGRGPLSSLKPQQSPTSAYLNLDSSRHDPFQLRLYHRSEKPIPLGRYDRRYKTGKWSTVRSPICIFLPSSLSCTKHLLIFPLVSVLYKSEVNGFEIKTAHLGFIPIHWTNSILYFSHSTAFLSSCCYPTFKHGQHIFGRSYWPQRKCCQNVFQFRSICKISLFFFLKERNCFVFLNPTDLKNLPHIQGHKWHVWG